MKRCRGNHFTTLISSSESNLIFFTFTVLSSHVYVNEEGMSKKKSLSKGLNVVVSLPEYIEWILHKSMADLAKNSLNMSDL